MTDVLQTMLRSKAKKIIMKKIEMNVYDNLNYTVKGLSADISEGLVQLHGENSIEVEIPSYLSLLVEEVLHPFYIFQVYFLTYIFQVHFLLFIFQVYFLLYIFQVHFLLCIFQIHFLIYIFQVYFLLYIFQVHFLIPGDSLPLSSRYTSLIFQVHFLIFQIHFLIFQIHFLIFQVLFLNLQGTLP